METELTKENLIKELEQKESEIQSLHDLDKAKTKFSAIITHDLKNPLSPILGYSELLLGETIGKLDETQKGLLQEIFDSATSLLHSIQNLSDLHRLESSDLKLYTSDLFANDLIEKSVEKINDLAKKKNIDIVINSESDLKLKCDEDMVLEIFEKLVENSIKFVPETGGKIEISAKKDNDSIVFMVKDNGIGISNDKQTDLFKKFYELDVSLNRKTEALGLGLIICKSLIEIHHGKIWLESQEGKGSEFYFSIPIG